MYDAMLLLAHLVDGDCPGCNQTICAADEALRVLTDRQRSEHAKRHSGHKFRVRPLLSAALDTALDDVVDLTHMDCAVFGHMFNLSVALHLDTDEKVQCIRTLLKAAQCYVGSISKISKRDLRTARKKWQKPSFLGRDVSQVKINI